MMNEEGEKVTKVVVLKNKWRQSKHMCLNKIMVLIGVERATYVGTVTLLRGIISREI